MEALANMLIAAFDLVEAEGRALHRNLVRLGLAAVMVLVGSLVALLGLGFILTGVYWWLAQQMPAPEAAIVFGLIALGVSGLCLWTARNLIQ